MPLPFVEHVGVQILECADGTSLLALPIRALHNNSHGVVHGGAMFTLADTGMGAALYSTLERGESCATIEIKINYFLPVTEGTVECRSHVVHRGRTVANVESILTVGAKVVAKANGTFAIRAAKPGNPG